MLPSSRKPIVRSRFAALISGVALAFLAGCGGQISSNGMPSPAPSGPPPALQLTSFVSGLASPDGMESAHDGSGRLFVLEQAGNIRIIRSGALAATPFLDIAAKVISGGELGLLGLTFHPNYATNRKFYVNYTRPLGSQWETVIAEYLVSAANPDQADPASERILLTVAQPFANHNGGQMAFGPDGFLYIGLGDGGSGGDPLGNGQNTQTLLGKILRIDVNAATAGRAYAIPPDNPFAAGGGAPEIFAYGFRNPWRFSFDSATGTLFAGDVGQDSFEEVDIVQKGANYGWNIMEGSHCFQPATGCNMTGLTLPINDYGRDQGGTVIGGFVYRGSAIPGLVNAYVFGDFLSGRIWGLRQNSSGTWERTELAATAKLISSFGRDENGELYVVDYAGAVWKLVAQ
ncbi:MAG: PQQ-dependent sugar dehydrogenase [Acidobacteriia bacterium]|nr:PQQ-dependent sugar dehydrogenase [Terriglobia bacterium]